jgi:hypothetical protein
MRERGLVTAIGGSGLLASLGLVEEVHDWDLTTDAPTHSVVEALRSAGWPFRNATVRDGVYATRDRFAVEGADHEVDVLVGFAAYDGDQVVHLPTRVTGHWNDLPMADPVVWARAYRLIGRTDRAALLDEWLRRDDTRQM